MVYTKTASINAPITNTYVGIEPCLDPKQAVKVNDDDTDKGSYNYALEIVPETCSSYITDRPDVDPRYMTMSTTDASFTVSEYTLQVASGVFEKLK